MIMNRKTMNRILRCFAVLFVVMSIVMVSYLLFSDVITGNKTSPLIQSLILLLCSIWLFVVVRKSTKSDK